MKMNKIIPVIPCSKRDLDSLAIKILSDSQPEALDQIISVDIEKIFDFYIPEVTNVKTGFIKLKPGILGETNARNMTSYVDSDLAESPLEYKKRRCRATIAHETSHCLKHVRQLKMFESVLGKDQMIHYRVKKNNIPSFKDPEWQAWYLAGALLMPKNTFLKALEKYDQNELTNIFDLNQSFVNVRISKLGRK